MPPPIQSSIRVSAVALGFSSAASAASKARPGPAASADRVAALAVLRKSRRAMAFITLSGGWLINQLKLGQHGQRPKQVFHLILLRRLAEEFVGQSQLGRRRLSTDPLLEELGDEVAVRSEFLREKFL